MMRLRSLRARTGAAFTLLVACLLLGLSFVLASRAQRLEERRARNTLEQARARVEREWAAPDDPRGLSASAESEGLRLLRRARGSSEAREAAEDAQSVALLLIDARGGVLYRSPGHAPPWPLGDAGTLGEGGGWKVIQARHGATRAVLALPRFRARMALQRQWESLLALSALALAYAGLGSWILVGHTLRPIGMLSRQARAASRSGAPGLQARLSAPSPDREVVELVETFNALLQRLSEDASARGRFYAAASHELRTPLQGLSGHLDLALSRERDAQGYRAALEEARAQSRRLASLVSELLRLNQLEMATSTPPAEELDLPDLLESLLRSLGPSLEARGVRLETLWPPEASGSTIVAPRAHAEMLARNLLDNAAKYTPEGGLIRVQAQVQAQAAQQGRGAVAGGQGTQEITLEVWNSCQPSADWRVEKWCEPFFRPDASRRSQTGGSGLGLALVKALCEANGWALALSAQPDGVLASVTFTTRSSQM